MRRPFHDLAMLLSAILVWLVNLPASSRCHADDQRQHDRVAQRRAGVQVIVHRGSSEFAHENTLEAYRASLELGADGNEIDIRTTRDGVLVCFHDDMLDHLLEAFGDVADYDWAELRTFRFRRPGQFGEFCRIPTLEEVLELHRIHAGLMHLDIKRPGLEKPISELLTRLDLWDHVVAVNGENGPEIIKDSRCRMGRYKGSLYADRAEVDPTAIADMLKKPGDMVIVDDPRGVLVALGRKIGQPSREPVTRLKRLISKPLAERTVTDLLAILLDDADWNSVPKTDEEKSTKAQLIRRRAEAADEIRHRRLNSAQIVSALERRVRRRSLHPDWMYHGLDGAFALRALAELRAPQFVELARFCLWRDDAATELVRDPRWKTPRTWVDFRTKAIEFDLLEQFPGEPTERLCRDYLALSNDEANRLGPPQFESAVQALLTVNPTEATALALLHHRRMDIRGRTILTCLSHLDQPWSRSALTKATPHALDFVPSAK
ncbi:MAG: glycerophosphodiester phosphodiesterase family protein [Planctomycetales bacterium]|nr:glycerophosphodiester phosphodiesterase family protein [Planctomycetales bacterium]